MDGLLLDSERLARDTFVQACRAMRWEPDLAVYELCIGSTYEATERILKTGYGADFPFEAVAQRWATLYETRVLTKPVDVKAGALELLLRLQELAIPVALATSTQRSIATAKLKNARLHDYFDQLVCGGETARGKPHPDPYIKAVGHLRLDAGQCWALEDSDNGVRAAHAAGLRVFQVPDLVSPGDDVRALGHRVVDSLFSVLELLAA